MTERHPAAPEPPRDPMLYVGEDEGDDQAPLRVDGVGVLWARGDEPGAQARRRLDFDEQAEAIQPDLVHIGDGQEDWPDEDLLEEVAAKELDNLIAKTQTANVRHAVGDHSHCSTDTCYVTCVAAGHKWL